VSPSLPQISGAKVITTLGRLDFVQVSQRGSHVKLRNSSGNVVIVPLHRELAKGTLASILRQSGISLEDFLKEV